MPPPLVSIVIPTRNGMATLPAVLSRLKSQRLDAEREIVAIDTASTDGSAALLASEADRVIAIPTETFNHGATRNRAIAESRGEFVVLLSQDAEPVGETWLEHLLAPLRRSPQVAGTYARQIPRDDAGAIARHYVAQWAGAASVAKVSRLRSPDDFDRMTPIERLRACTFDNVCSCIRRSVWSSHPFRAASIAEDLAWARDVLFAGFAIEYVPDAVVRHSHERSPWYEFDRTRLLHKRLYELFGLRTIPGLPHLARAIASSAHLHLRCRRSSTSTPDSLGRALALAVAWPAGQYIGGLAGSNGWDVRPGGQV